MQAAIASKFHYNNIPATRTHTRQRDRPECEGPREERAQKRSPNASRMGGVVDRNVTSFEARPFETPLEHSASTLTVD